jgi:predicted ribosome quality control (RQC) complex YloA/Tae2 family protein
VSSVKANQTPCTCPCSGRILLYVYDSLTLSAVLKELRETIVGRRLSKVYQPGDLTLVLSFPGLGPRRLILSADPTGPRVHLISKAPPNPPSPPEFCTVLRSHLEGAILTGISQPNFDRVARFAFERDQGKRTLIAELMGRHSNIILVDSSGKIIAAAKTVGKRQSRARPIVPGRRYAPAPSQGKLDPLKVTPAALEALLDRLPSEETASEFLKGRFLGFHPRLAANALAEAGIAPDTKLRALKEEAQRICTVFDVLLEIVIGGHYDPVVVEDESGRIVDFGAHPWSVDAVAGSIRRLDSANAAAEAFFADREAEAELDRARKDLGKLLTTQIKRREKALDGLRRDIEASREEERMQRSGDLILANLSRISKGARSVRLPDLYADAACEVEIELDPTLDPNRNAQRYFTMARKARSRLAKSTERMVGIEGELEALSGLVEELSRARAVAEVDALRSAAASLGVSEAKFPPARREEIARERDELSKAGVRRVEFLDYEILYGRSAAANDYLTTKVAAKDDYWLHARGCRSAHVVVRTRGKPDRVPRGVLQEAALLAARTSEAKHSSLVPVDYTLAKYVRKPRRSKPGMAAYEREKTIMVAPQGGK